MDQQPVQIYASINNNAYKEIKILAIRQDKKESQIAGELLDALFENQEETPALNLANVYTLQKRVSELEATVKEIKALLSAVTKQGDIDKENNDIELESILDT